MGGIQCLITAQSVQYTLKCTREAPAKSRRRLGIQVQQMKAINGREENTFIDKSTELLQIKTRDNKTYAFSRNDNRFGHLG